MPMEWKKFKKERISLNYTVMLVPHSQKKMIHFKTPVWIFGVFFLGLLVLTGACLFFAGSRHQLKQVRREKAQLEQEWEELARQKDLADQENEALLKEQKLQEQELSELEQRARNTLQELEALVDRESQIRQELGLGQLPEGESGAADTAQEGASVGEGALDPESTINEPQEEPAGIMQEGEEAGQPKMQGQTFRIASAGMPRLLAENTADFEAIRSELLYMQNRLAEKNGQYDSYMNTITERKEAEAAEKLRKEALRASIVTSALQYVGNPYVYGGNNPNTGVDCSGFTRYVLGNTAGVYLNRTAAEQSSQGRSVSVQEARPGDLVFYSNGSSVNHVAIYIGDGRVVHASNERVGIVTSDMYYRTPVKIKNVLGD